MNCLSLSGDESDPPVEDLFLPNRKEVGGGGVGRTGEVTALAPPSGREKEARRVLMRPSVWAEVEVRGMEGGVLVEVVVVCRDVRWARLAIMYLYIVHVSLS